MVSLWLVPSSEVAAKLQRVMAIRPTSNMELKKESYPEFYPHITLASLPQSVMNANAADTMKSLEKACRLSPPPYIVFRTLDTGDTYVRSVLIRLELSPELKELHTNVHRELDIEPESPEFPHLSLCYIANEDAEHGERQRFYEMMEGASIVDADGNLSFDCGEEQGISGFKAEEVWVVDCSGATEDWQVLHKISIVG